MKASIENGVLMIESEDEKEQYSLHMWLKAFEDNSQELTEIIIVNQENKDFSPEEGETILVRNSDDMDPRKRTYLYTDKQGKFVCVDGGYGKEYKKGDVSYPATAWLIADPLPKMFCRVLRTYLGNIVIDRGPR
jgi:hypothetical protein